MRLTENYNLYNEAPPKGISWRAILAGVAATLSVMLILNLIGLAIGMWSIEPTEEHNPLSGLGTGAIIWWVLSNLIVLFIGGFVAARVGASFTTLSGIIQGIMTWAVYTLISAWLLTSVVGSIISGVGNMVGGVLSTTGDLVSEQLGPMVKEQFEGLDVSLGDAKTEFYSLLEDTGKEELDPENLEAKAEESGAEVKDEMTSRSKRTGRADADIEGTFSKTKNRFEQSFEAIDKEALVNILVERTDMNRREAEAAVDNTTAEFERAREEFDDFMEEAEQKAREKGEKIAEAAGDASIYLALALVLGMIAAALGGFVGVKQLRDDYIKNDPVRHTSDSIHEHGTHI